MSTSRTYGSVTINTLSDLQGTPKEGVRLGGHHTAKSPDTHKEDEAKAHNDKNKAHSDKSKAHDQKEGVQVQGDVTQSLVTKVFEGKNDLTFKGVKVTKEKSHRDVKRTVRTKTISEAAVCINGDVEEALVTEKATVYGNVTFGS